MAALPEANPARRVRYVPARLHQPRNLKLNPAILSHRISGVGSTAVTTPACAALPSRPTPQSAQRTLYSLHRCYSVSIDSSAP